MSEELFQFIESPETATIRINTDAINHLGIIFNGIEDHDMKQELFKMLCSHSKFVLETSEKMVQNRTLVILVTLVILLVLVRTEESYCEAVKEPQRSACIYFNY